MLAYHKSKPQVNLTPEERQELEHIRHPERNRFGM
jgi:hypothetical protein